MSPINIFKNKRNTEHTKSSLKLLVPNSREKSAFTLAEVFSTHFKNNRKYAFTLAEVFSTHSANNRKYAFTLAEVLITLGIIGVVAALILPTIITKVNDAVYKTAYKKAYRDVNNAYNNMRANDVDFQEIVCVANEECPNCCYDPNFGENFKILSRQFQATKTCFGNSVADMKKCWECDKGQSGFRGSAPNYYGCNAAPAFVDISGRAWTMYSGRESTFLVDTNGYKKPNELGKDRWFFRFPSPKDSRTNRGFIIPLFSYDYKTKDRFCPNGNCKFQSWLE